MPWKLPRSLISLSMFSKARMISISRWMRRKSALENRLEASSSLQVFRYWSIGMGANASWPGRRLSTGLMIYIALDAQEVRLGKPVGGEFFLAGLLVLVDRDGGELELAGAATLDGTDDLALGHGIN